VRMSNYPNFSRAAFLCSALACAGAALAQEPSASAPTPLARAEGYRQWRADARWTGPILAPSAGSLPPGHWLVEPYVFDVISQGRYSSTGQRQPGARNETLGSLTYINYGLTDRVTLGVIPRFWFNDLATGRDSSGIRVGDVSLQAQYRFTQFEEGRHLPTLAVNLGVQLPTGKFDELGDRPADGVGGGAVVTTLSLYSQHFFWMPNGRILRTRLNFSYAVADTAELDDVSVYGTVDGFRGRAQPGDSFVGNWAFEYSATREWVLAIDLQYQHDANTRLRGAVPMPGGGAIPVAFDSGSRESFSLAPAVEYNWSDTKGVIVGAVFTAAGRNTGASWIPVVAVNMVF
jgi:hypothetical protein